MQSRGPPKIYATSDVHSPRYLSMFVSSLPRKGEACLFLFAGDIVDRGRVEAAKPVFNAVRQAFPGSRLVAVFGNEEYHDREEEYRRAYPFVDWLNDEYKVYDCWGLGIAVIGTRGAIDRLTTWQRKHMPWLEDVYSRRPSIIAKLIDKARREADKIIVLSHYGLAKETIVGEPPRLWPYLYSRAMERVIREKKPDAAVHGHAHRGTPKAMISGVPVYNVALPLNRKPVRVTFRIGLDVFGVQ